MGKMYIMGLEEEVVGDLKAGHVGAPKSDQGLVFIR